MCSHDGPERADDETVQGTKFKATSDRRDVGHDVVYVPSADVDTTTRLGEFARRHLPVSKYERYVQLACVSEGAFGDDLLLPFLGRDRAGSSRTQGELVVRRGHQRMA